jgi:hypothetical protein
MLPDSVDFRLAGPEDATGAGAMFASGNLPGTRIATPIHPARKAG